MSDIALLDLLFVAIIVLLGIIASWRGPSREIIASAGILLGSELALAWGDDAGEWVSDQFDVSLRTAQFAMSLVLITVCALVAGYLPGSVLARAGDSRSQRFSGFAIGLANGALLVAFALRFFYLRYVEAGEADPLEDSLIVNLFWNHFDWLIVTVVVLVVLTTVVAKALSPDHAGDATGHRSTGAPGSSLPVPPEVPGKLEPAYRKFDSQAGTYRADIPDPLQSMPMGTINAVTVSPGGARGPEGSTWHPDAAVTTTMATSSQPSPAPGDGSQRTTPRGSLQPRWCVACGMRLAQSDRFCQECGREQL